MEKHWVNLFNQSDFQQLDQKIFAYLSDSDSAILEFKKWLSLSDSVHPSDTISNVTKWNKMCKYIEHVFPNDSSLVLQLKKKYILSNLNTTNWKHFRASRFKVFLNILHTVFDTKEIKSMKETLQKSLVNGICSHFWWEVDYNEQNFHVVRLWCYGDDDEAILRFKKDLPIDRLLFVYYSILWYTGYSRHFKSLHKDYCEIFDKYFQWYLDSDDAIKEL